jgi:hypothetical protein
MEHEPLDHWIASFLPTHSLRQIDRIVDAGSGFDQGSIDSLAASFANRVEMMEQVEARAIQPLISAGKTEVPPGYAEAVRTPATWNEPLNEILVRMVDETGRRWNVISGLPGDFTKANARIGECS